MRAIWPVQTLHANLAAAAPIIPVFWHLCGWIERMPEGTRQNDGQETGIIGGCGCEISVDCDRKSCLNCAELWTGFLG